MRDSGNKHLDLIMLDTVSLLAAFLLAYCTKFGGFPFASSSWMALLLAAIIAVVIPGLMGPFYDRFGQRKLPRELIICVEQALLMELLLAICLFSFKVGMNYSRQVIFETGLFFVVFALPIRVWWRDLLQRRVGLTQQILIGGSDNAQRYYSAHHRDAEIVCWLADTRSDADGTTDMLESRLRGGFNGEVIAALSIDEDCLMIPTIELCEKYGVKVRVIPFFSDYISRSIQVDVENDQKLLDLRTTPLHSPSNALLKRLMDIVISLLLIIVSSPVMLIAAVGVKLTSPGPILFRQIRVGQGKEEFTMLKFRSMKVNADSDTAWSKDSDPRKTKFGSFIRKTSIDELPQFFNVLRGDMSLIGPRPELPFHVDHFQDEIPLYQVRHMVRPGITGWAQVNGLRGDTSISERVKYDVWYIENWSLVLDLRIFVRTVFGGMLNKEKIN